MVTIDKLKFKADCFCDYADEFIDMCKSASKYNHKRRMIVGYNMNFKIVYWATLDCIYGADESSILGFNDGEYAANCDSVNYEDITILVKDFERFVQSQRTR